jgi:hypothetical protein
MEWFERLNEYFPEHEMKDPRHIQADKDVYHKEETDEYIMLYAEFPTFISFSQKTPTSIGGEMNAIAFFCSTQDSRLTQMETGV